LAQWSDSLLVLAYGIEVKLSVSQLVDLVVGSIPFSCHQLINVLLTVTVLVHLDRFIFVFVTGTIPVVTGGDEGTIYWVFASMAVD